MLQRTLSSFVRAEGDDLLQLFDWLTKVWYHLNGILEEYCEPDTTIGEHIGLIVVHYWRAV